MSGMMFPMTKQERKQTSINFHFNMKLFFLLLLFPCNKSKLQKYAKYACWPSVDQKRVWEDYKRLLTFVDIVKLMMSG